MKLHNVRVLRSCSLVGLVCLVVSGCTAPGPATLTPPIHFVRATSAAPVSTMAPLTVAASVQPFPLYQQATQACEQKDFKGAERLLQRLAATPGLSVGQKRFVLEQRNLCLRDAGRPVSALPPVVLPATPATSAVQLPLPEESDCGPRALLLTCITFDIRTTREQLRLLAGTTGKGTSLAGLAKAAQAVGLKTEGVQVSREALPQIQMPAIAWSNGNHFCAVLALHGSGEAGTALIHDPNQPHEETISQERLLRLSSGYLLLVHR